MLHRKVEHGHLEVGSKITVRVKMTGLGLDHLCIESVQAEWLILLQCIGSLEELSP